MQKLREYRCTRNSPYSHPCLGRNDLSARQGYYIMAASEEEAWQKMATRYPEETEQGFTVQEWQGFDVVVEEVKDEVMVRSLPRCNCAIF